MCRYFVGILSISETIAKMLVLSMLMGLGNNILKLEFGGATQAYPRILTYDP